MVLDEPARRFYQFLEHAIIIEAETQYAKLNSSMFPYLEQKDRAKQLKLYRDIFEERDSKKEKEIDVNRDREGLKKLLSKKN